MILFLCHGNVARSQFAEALAKKNGIINVSSAGIKISKTRQGNQLKEDGPSALRAVKYFKKITGIDISTNIRKLVTKKLVNQSDKIIILTKDTNIPNYVFNINHEFWEIEDPHDFDFEGYKKVINKIKEKVDELTKSSIIT